MRLQPALHDLVTCVHAPTVVLSAADGQVRQTGAQGAFRGSLRVLSLAEVRIDDTEPLPVLSVLDGPSGARFVSLDRRHGNPGPDPTVRLERRRLATAAGLEERLSITSTAVDAFTTTVSVDLAVDLASVHAVNAGETAPPPLPPTIDGTSATWEAADGIRVTVTAPGAQLQSTEAGTRASWDVRVFPRDELTLGWSLTTTDAGAVVGAAPGAAPWTRPTVVADDAGLAALVTQSLDDLDALRMSLSGRPDGQFLAAGTPWYLTLF
ncbi:MAG: glycogen debranching N-terminal domain-containing protein, partial [Mycobacteriales bacterium]